jgi:hypothetical protein
MDEEGGGDGSDDMSNATNNKKPLADRIMLGIIAQTGDGGKLEVYMDAHNITFVRIGPDAVGTGYITALPRSAFMLAAMTLAKEMETRVDEWCNEEPAESLNELANDLLVTHAEASAAYPLSVFGDGERDAGTCVSDVSMYGVKSMASASCMDNSASLYEMLKLTPAARGGS